ncbi:MAG: GNAT family N-acetyltransferase [Anaerolineae bacterium]|nr:GNAT family N-acetyltransferase [Anaerolineae bacterium]
MNPILFDFPDVIESERLIIRGLRPNDGVLLDEAIRESYDQLRPWMRWARHPPTRAETEAYCRQANADFIRRESLGMILLLKNDGVCLGGSGLHNIDWAIPKFEIGYWLRTSYVGQGYATEAVNALTAFAFDALNARRLEIRADDRNVRSWRVAERCGFALEGILRQCELDNDGGLRDMRIYAKVR